MTAGYLSEAFRDTWPEFQQTDQQRKLGVETCPGPPFPFSTLVRQASHQLYI